MVFSGKTLYHLFFNQTKMKNIYSRIDNPSPSFFSKERGKKRRNSLPPGERQKK
jgi:hypothetical protein